MDPTPPTPITGDYIKMGYMAILGMIGAPVNMVAYADLREAFPRLSSGAAARLHPLKSHLNLSDLMVMLLYIPSQVCWTFTYSWRGGDLLCKVNKYANNLTFQISSNVMVCIALDRILSLLVPVTPEKGLRRVRIMLWVAWVIAGLTSLPQLYFWGTFEPFPNWKQCATVWTIERFNHYHKNNMSNDSSTNGTTPASTSMNNTEYNSVPEYLYSLNHVVLVFYIPMIIIATCYTLVIGWICYHSPRSANNGNVDIEPTSNYITRNTEMCKTPYNYSESTRTANGVDVKASQERRSLVAPPPSVANGYADSNRFSGGKLSSANLYKARHSVVFHQGVRKVKRNAVRISVLLILAYIICWTPYNAMTLWRIIDFKSFQKYENLTDPLSGLVILNSVINPFLYGMFGKVRRYTRSG